jgi:hypothetical protein
MRRLRCRTTPSRVFVAQHRTEQKADFSWYRTALYVVRHGITIHSAALSVAIMNYTVRESRLDSARVANVRYVNKMWLKVSRTVERTLGGRTSDAGPIRSTL